MEVTGEDLARSGSLAELGLGHGPLDEDTVRALGAWERLEGLDLPGAGLGRFAAPAGAAPGEEAVRGPAPDAPDANGSSRVGERAPSDGAAAAGAGGGGSGEEAGGWGRVWAAVCSLARVRALGLEANGLSSLPEALSALPALAELRLARNAFAALPASLARAPLAALTALDLSRNHIAALDGAVAPPPPVLSGHAASLTPY